MKTFSVRAIGKDGNTLFYTEISSPCLYLAMVETGIKYLVADSTIAGFEIKEKQ